MFPNTDLPANNTLNNIIITVEEVLQALKLGKFSGTDNIDNRILKEIALSYLQSFFNYSLSHAIFLVVWKQANVSRLYKKDDPSLVCNYRPISLLKSIGKVKKKIVHKHIFNYFNDHVITMCFQSRFVPRDSTVNQLVDIYNTFCKSLDNGLEIRAVFVTYAKPLIRLHNGILYIYKLKGLE